jgi:5-methylcytosine-specific restriction endonuclease McrA
MTTDTISGMTQKDKLHEYYLKRRAAMGADEIRKRNRESYLKNREKTLASQRTYYRNNSAKVNARVRAYHKRRPDVKQKAIENYRHRHPERIRASTKSYRLKNGNLHQKNWAKRNRDRIRARRQSQREKWVNYNREWRDKNRSKINALRRAFRINNVEICRTREVIKASKRRAIKKKAELNPASIKQFIVGVRSMQAVACFWCKDKIAGKDCHIDHIIALSRGGKHAVENLCVSCEPCNLSKGPKSLQDWNLVKPDPQLVLI